MNLTILELKEWSSRGSEIEFEYKNKEYSMIYFTKNGECWISFFEFYKVPINVKGAKELLEITINDESLKSIWLKLSLNDMYIT